MRCLHAAFDEEQHTVIQFDSVVPVKFVIDTFVVDSLMAVGVLERAACNEDDRAVLDEQSRVSCGNDVDSNLVGAVVASRADANVAGINAGRGKPDVKA